MASTLKGENLRVLLDNKCVAASRNCTLHLVATVEDMTTKDTVSKWTENEVTGFAFDASVDALVANGGKSGKFIASEKKTIAGTDYLYEADTMGRPIIYALKKGDVVQFDCDAHEYHMVILSNTLQQVLAASATGSSSLRYVAPNDINVVFGVEGDNQLKPCSYAITPNEVQTLNKLEVGKTYHLRTSITTGNKNRTESQGLYEGDAILTDINVNAGNRAVSTYTAKFTGTSKLSPVQ